MSDLNRRSARGSVAASGLSLALHLALGPTAFAAPPAGAAEEAAQLKAKADDAFDNRRYAEALEQYQAALARGRDARLHYNIAQTLTALERYPEALVSYQAFLSEAPAGTLNAAQQERFFALLDEIKAKIARVEIKCEVAGARVLVRDKAIGATPLKGAISVNAGPAKVEVLAEGFKPFVTDVTLVGGSTQTIDVPLERIDFTGAVSITGNVAGMRVLVDGTPRGVAPVTLRLERGTHVIVGRAADHVDASQTVTIAPGDREDVSLSLRRAPDYTLAYLGFGVGALGVGAGTVTGILAYTTFKSAKDQCDTSAKECGPAGHDGLRTSKTWGVLSSIGFGVGLAGVGLGVYGLMTARRGDPGGRDDRRVGAAPVVDVIVLPAGLMMRGSF